MKAASLYARLGWRVLPVQPGGKRPLIADWVNAASSDAAHIAEWTAQFPGANLGVATGPASGVFILDVDPRSGGRESLAALEAEHGPLPVTTLQATPSDGSHYAFKDVPGLTNSASKLGPGLDIRAAGGQFVVAPSRTPAGQYRWIRPPWETPPADAPEWLIGLLKRHRAPIPDSGPTTRGYFPPASPEVLDAAREALEAHGPAVEGQGGDAHTFQAAALLVHDFALTHEEAAPLLEEWNETCQPPWDADALGAKLRGGAKYGSLPYGCKRALDAVQAAQKLVRDWEAAGSPQESIDSLIKAVRGLAAISGDPARHALIAKALVGATGLKAKDLALPKPAAPSAAPRQGEIRVSTDLHRVADESIRAMTPRVFARNGVLCEVVKAERTFIHDLEPARVLDLMSQSAVFVRNDENKGLVTQAAPAPVASILHARRTHAGVRVLEAVTTAPVLLADGTILQERGYSAAARVYLEPNVHVDVPEHPTQDDARAAVAVFLQLLSDFHFASAADFSSWLAAVLSPLVKSATGNAPAPLVCISASSPGSGKTLLSDTLARIVTGLPAEVRPYNPKDIAEWQKRLTSFVKAASPVNVFDNIKDEIGDESLDRLITSSTWSDRQLGASEAPPLPVVGTWLANGNNITPTGDTVRRVLVVRLEVDTERPQERTGFRIPDLAGYVDAHRAELLGAALTILRAYHVAGRPSMRLPSWGSFGAWSELVRGALVWAGAADPFLTQQRAAAELNEPEHDAHDFWLGVVEKTDGQAASIVTLANQNDAQGVLGARDPLTQNSFRRFIARFLDKPRAGRRIRKVRAEGSARYVVEAV